ncbi:MAG: protein kinase domain-containing protein [Gemmatimonadales bacterium]
MADVLELLRTALEERYAVERLIGEGGMATVYLANDIRHDRKVAIKVLRPELAASIGADRFLREIKVAAKLQHPNILPLYDSGEASDFLYYVMPFVEGESLRVLMEREQQLSLPDSIQLTCDIADALHYAHTNKVVHRDIKPENILLRDGRPLVADFGIARAVSAAGEKLTETGMAVGTPHYMSPEQSLASEHIDGRTDQYSLACMLYEMLVGQPPFHGPNAMAILARHSLEAVPSLQVVRNSIPDEVEDAIMRALEKTPADRFPTIRDFADALAEVDLGSAARRTSSRSMRARSSAPQRVRRTTGSVRAEPKGLPAKALAFARSRGKGFWSIVAVVILVALGLSAWWVWLRNGPASRAASGFSPNRIAVMYFGSRGPSDSLGYVADGLTEALIHELSQVKALQVISQNGVLPYKKSAVPPDSVARALKVGTLVQGTLTQAGERLRVSVSLINAASGSEIASKTLERPRSEIFELQDDLAKEVSVFLRERLGQEIKLEQTKVAAANPKAWEMVQQAQQLKNDLATVLEAGDTAAAARQLSLADSILAQASALDPKWITPIVTRGWLAYQRRALARPLDKAYLRDWLKRASDDAEQALAIRPDDPDALDLRGTTRYTQWFLNLAPGPAAAAKLLADAEQDLRRSVAANPGQAHSWAVLSHMLMRKSETAEGKLAALRAYEADPYLTDAPAILYRLFSSSLDLEDGVEANHWCSEGLSRFSDDPSFSECQILLFALPGQKPDVGKAWKLLDQYVKLYSPNERDFRQREGQLMVAMALARAGLPDSARAVALRARADATVDPGRELVYFEALLRNMLGDRDETLRLVGTYLATNPQDRETMAKDDSWWWNGIRDDPRFKSLVGSAS